MKRLKELRENAGLTIRELADELEVNYSTLHQTEIGDRYRIDPNLLDKVCDYFNVTPNYLLGYEDDVKEVSDELCELKTENKLLKEALLRLAILLQ